MRTYSNRSRKQFNGRWFTWNGWTTSAEWAHGAANRNPNHDVVVEFSDTPYIYGGEVTTRPGYHIWKRRKPTMFRGWADYIKEDKQRRDKAKA